MIQVLVAIEGQYDSGSDASQSVVHQDGDRMTFCECSRQFATKHIGELFAQKAQSRGTAAQLLSKLASPSNVNSSSRGRFFETVMHTILSSGGSFEYKIVDVPCNIPASGSRGQPTSEFCNAQQTALEGATADARTSGGIAPGSPLRMHVTPLEVVEFIGGSNVNIGNFGSVAKQCASPCYLRPYDAAHPVIDACIYPDTLLNFKVSSGKASNLNEELLEDHLQSLPDLPRYYYDYIVPRDVYSTFRLVPLKRDAAAHPRVSRTLVRVVLAKLRPSVLPAAMHSPRGGVVRDTRFKASLVV